MSASFPPSETRLLTSFLVLIPSPLAGCGSHTVPVPYTLGPVNANWQIQVGTAITSPPTGLYLLGDIQTFGTQTTGIFTNFLPCSPAVSTYTGSKDASGNLTLKASFDTATIAPPPSQYALTTATLSGGGDLCQAAAGGPAVAIEIPPLGAVYSGTLTASSTSSGTATLTLAQLITANLNGQFPVSGTLQFTAPNCTVTTNLTGTISGTVVTLTGTNLTVNAYDTNAGTTLPTTLTYAATPCNAAPFTGTLTASPN